MRADELPIPEPCHEDWSNMTGDEKRRFCGACNKHVHDLSAMTATGAEETLAAEPDICVRYTVNEDGTLVHESSRRYFFKAAAGALLLGATPAIAAGIVQPKDEDDGLLASLKDRLMTWWNGDPEGCAGPKAPVLMGEPAYIPPDTDNDGSQDLIPEISTPPVVEPPPRRVIKGKPSRPKSTMGVVVRPPDTPTK